MFLDYLEENYQNELVVNVHCEVKIKPGGMTLLIECRSVWREMGNMNKTSPTLPGLQL